jgi:hypothetical protein
MSGLMDVTQRLARAVGPSLAGLLVAAFPLYHFFTIDAVSFLISAGAIAVLGSRMNWHSTQLHLDEDQDELPSRHLMQELLQGFSVVMQHKPVAFSISTTAIIAGLWGCAFMVGIPMVVKNSLGAGVGTYGFIIGAYGLGNVIGNVVLANLPMRRSLLVMFGGDIVLGLGFLVIALGHAVFSAIAGSFIAAIGGAVGDVVLLNVILTEIPAQHLGKVLSLRLTFLYAGVSIGLFAAAPIFAVAQPLAVIGVCSGIIVLCGLVGIILFGRQKTID